MHPSSILADRTPPDFLVYHEVVRTSRIWLKSMDYNFDSMGDLIFLLPDLTVINPAWLSTLGKPSLCTFSKPTKTIGGTMVVTPRFGPEGWELPVIKAQE